jgi:hypothetical protein
MRPKVENGDSEKVVGYDIKGLEKTFDMLKDSVERGKALAKKQMSYRDFRMYEKGADDAISVGAGFTHIIQAFKYVDLGVVHKTDNSRTTYTRE